MKKLLLPALLIGTFATLAGCSTPSLITLNFPSGKVEGAAIVDLEGAADGAVFPQRNDDDRVKIGEVILAQIVVDDDLVQQHGPLGHVADGVVLVQLVVILAHPHVGQHVANL